MVRGFQQWAVPTAWVMESGSSKFALWIMNFTETYQRRTPWLLHRHASLLALQLLWSTHRSAVQSSRSCGLCDRVRVAQRCEASCGLIFSRCLRLAQRIENDVWCCKEEIMSIPATWVHASEKGSKREPSNKYPTVVALLCRWCSIPAGRIEILGGGVWFLFWVRNCPRFYLKAEAGGSAALGLFDDLLANIFWKNGVRQQDFICELVGWPSLISFW